MTESTSVEVLRIRCLYESSVITYHYVLLCPFPLLLNISLRSYDRGFHIWHWVSGCEWDCPLAGELFVDASELLRSQVKGVKIPGPFFPACEHPMSVENSRNIYIYTYWLVLWNMTFIFHHIWDVILPIDSYFSRWWNCTTNQSIIKDYPLVN